MRALWDYAAFACTAEFTVFVRTVRLRRVCARLGGFASFTCAVGFCFTRACFGIPPLSHVPWAFAALMPALGFRRFRMCRGPLPHSCLFLGSPLSRVPLAFAAPCLLWDFAAFACAVGICRTRACFWNFAAFACTTAFAAPVPAVEFCHFLVHRGLMTRPRSLGALTRPCLRANATSTSAAEF